MIYGAIIILIAIACSILISRSLRVKDENSNLRLLNSPPQICYPPNKVVKSESNPPEIKSTEKIPEFIVDKKVTEQVIKSIANNPELKKGFPKPEQTSEKQLKTEFNKIPAKHLVTLNDPKSKRHSKKARKAERKAKINSYIHPASPIQKISISDHDEEIYKQAEKLRIEKLKQVASQKNKRYFAQKEYEESLNSKPQESKITEKNS